MNRKINVLIISNMYPSAVNQMAGVFVHDQVKALVENENCEITVISPQPFCPAVVKKLIPQWKYYPELPLVEEKNGIRVCYPKYLTFGAGSFYIMKGLLMPYTFRKLLKEGKWKKFDIVHAHITGFHMGWLAKKLKEEHNKRLIITVHGSGSVYPSQKARGFFMRKTLKSADKIIAVSEWMKKRVLKYGFDEKKVTVIGNGAFSEFFHPIEKNYARNALNLPVDAKIIVCVASLNKNKGQRELIASFSTVKKAFEKSLLVLIGAGPVKETLTQQAKELGLIDAILFAGQKPHEKIPLWLNASDLFVLPSYNEGMPVSLLEALICGKPVVATTVGGIPEVITSAEYGILVEPGNVLQLSNALLEGLRKNWQEDIIAQYGAQFTWDAVAKKIRKIYEEILTGEPGYE